MTKRMHNKINNVEFENNLDLEENVKKHKQNDNINWIRICMGQDGNRLFPRHWSALCEAMLESSITCCIASCAHETDTVNTVFLPLEHICLPEILCGLTIRQTIQDEEDKKNAEKEKENNDATKNIDEKDDTKEDRKEEDSKEHGTEEDEDTKTNEQSTNENQNCQKNLKETKFQEWLETHSFMFSFYEMIFKLKINYHAVLRFFDFFGMDTLCNLMLRHVLSHHSMYDFAYSINALSAFQITHHTQAHPMLGILYDTDISILDRLDYICGHHRGDIIGFSQKLEQSVVASQLNIESEFLSLLHPNECVIAGGSCLFLACPWTKFTNRCDIDFFVFRQWDDYLKQFYSLCQKTGRELYINGKSVITAIGKFGVRRLQLIYSNFKHPQELINEFDLSPLQCFYDGTLLSGTVYAQRDWLTKTCHNTTLRCLQAKRLYGIQWKGFQLSSEAQQFLHQSKMQQKQKQLEYEFCIPFLLPTIPKEVQDAHLYRLYKYKPLAMDNVSMVPFSDRHYANQDHIWWDWTKLEQYVQDFSFLPLTPVDKWPFTIWNIDTQFVLEIKKCDIDILQEKDHCYLNNVHPLFLQDLCTTCLRLYREKWQKEHTDNASLATIWKEWFHLKPSITRALKLYKNGILVENHEEELQTWPTKKIWDETNTPTSQNNIYVRNNVRVFLKPEHLYKKEEENCMHLRWKLDSLFFFT